MNVDDDILSLFIEESREVLVDLQAISGSLKKVRIPDEEESKRLSDLTQKLHRLISGASSVGFHMFSPLSRKTSMLAERCAEIKEMMIRLLILNLNFIISILHKCFNNLESIKDMEAQIPEIEKRIDICMTAVGLDMPDVKSQDEIDNIIGQLKGKKSQGGMDEKI